MLTLPYKGSALKPVFAYYVDEYGNQARPALQLVDATTGEHWATVTVNLSDDPLEPGEFFVKDWGGNEPIIEALEDAGWLVPTGRAVPTGHVYAKVMRYGGDLLAEYERAANA